MRLISCKAGAGMEGSSAARPHAPGRAADGQYDERQVCMVRRMMVSVILAFMVLLTGCGQMNHGGTAAPSLTAGTEKQEPQITGHTDSRPEPQTTGHSDSSPESRTTALWDSDALMKDLYTEAPYSVSYSELIDTYLIAWGLYFDFGSPYLFPADAMVD